MPIEIVRIDDRLIHGQVATAWIKDYSIEQVFIINDDVKNDQMQLSIIEMTSPPDVIVRIFGVKEFIDINKKTIIKRKTMIILTSPKDVYELIEGGVDIKSLNVGGMRFSSDRRKLSKAVFVTKEDEEYLNKILDKGIDIEIRLIPRNEAVKIEKLL